MCVVCSFILSFQSRPLLSDHGPLFIEHFLVLVDVVEIGVHELEDVFDATEREDKEEEQRVVSHHCHQHGERADDVVPQEWDNV